MNKNHKEFWLEYVFISTFVIMFLIIIRLLTPLFISPEPGFDTTNDHYHYINMARNPFKPKVAIAPFCYRILIPFIAWLMPFDLVTNFLIISFVSFYLTGIVLYFLLKEFFTKTLAVTGITLFFSLRWTAMYFFYNIWLTESLTFFFLVLCFWAINKSNLKIYAISLFFGVLTKEILLFTIPVLLISEFLKMKETNTFHKKYLLNSLFPILPGLIIFIIIRIIIVPDPVWGYDYFYLIEKIGFNRRFTSIIRFDFEFYYFCTIGTWGIILCFFPFFIKEDTFLHWVKLYGIFICLIYSQLLIASDIERIIVSGFYPMILLALSGLENLKERKNINELIFLGISLCYFIIQLILHIFIF